MIARLLFYAAKTPLASAGVRFGFGRLAALLPIRRVVETPTVLAFHHPRPTWHRHVLLIPKPPIPSLLDVMPGHLDVVREIVHLAAPVADKLGLGGAGYSLLVNGGPYQHVGQLHFHLAAPTAERDYDCADPNPACPPLVDADLVVAYPHPRPRRAVHVVIRPKWPVRNLRALTDAHDDHLDAVVVTAQRLVHELRLLPAGFALVLNEHPDQGTAPLCFHLVSGAEATPLSGRRGRGG